MANQPPNSSVALRWSHSTSPASDIPDPVDASSRGYVTKGSPRSLVLMLKFVGYFPSHPRGYRENPRYPVLRGPDHCHHCLCTPCVIQLPPDFLRGSASPHPANDEKRFRLYRLFWKVLSDVGLWNDEEYLRRKEGRTVIHDKREIMPKCVVTVSTRTLQYPHYINPYLSLHSPGDQVQVPQP